MCVVRQVHVPEILWVLYANGRFLALKIVEIADGVLKFS